MEKGYIRDNFSAKSAREFYEHRHNFPEKYKKIISLHLDDYRYNMEEMYIKEQMILVFEILSLYKNLDKNFEIMVGNSEYIADKEFLSTLADLKVENLTLNGQIMFKNYRSN